MSGGTSQCLLGELTRLGEDGVLAELCNILKQSGCGWLEEAVPAHINRDQFYAAEYNDNGAQAKKASTDGPKRCIVDPIPTMPGMPERGDRRGSRARASNLHGLWYDPSYPIAGECFHEHDIRSTQEWAMHKDPLLLSCSIFPIALDGYASIDKSPDIRKGAARFASCLRWHKQSQRRRRCKANKKAGNGLTVPSS